MDVILLAFQQQNDPAKATAKIHRRGTEGFWDTDKTGAEDDNNSVELKVRICAHIQVQEMGLGWEYSFCHRRQYK